MPTELWKLPVPATALLKSPVFAALPKRRCEISFEFEADGGAPTKVRLVFDGVEAYKCTYLTACSADMFNTAYAKLVRLGTTPWLSELLKSYKGTAPAAGLQHLMICFDDGPCYEVVCTGFSAA